jgi:hypothetical protein
MGRWDWTGDRWQHSDAPDDPVTDKLPTFPAITTVEQAQAVADVLLEHVRGAAESAELLKLAPSAVDILTANGVIRASEVVELAGAVGLDLAAAATLLEKESGGGLNVWGHDPVNTGGIYTKGGMVTQGAYMAYKTQRSRLGAQGVGPCQLTYGPLQDIADQQGGCWDWRTNIKVGFDLLATYARSGPDLRTAFRKYNGSGPAAESYANDAMGRLAAWHARLSGAETDDMAAVPQDQWNQVYQQLCGVFAAWGGGLTDDKGTPYDLLQFLLRANVQLNQLTVQLEAVENRLNSLSAGAPAGNGGVSEDDVHRIVAGVLDRLSTGIVEQQRR